MSHSRSGRGTQSLRQSSPGVGSSGCLPMILSGFKMVRLRHTTDLLTLALFGTPILNCRLLTYMIGPVSASEVESNPVSTADSSTFWHTLTLVPTDIPYRQPVIARLSRGCFWLASMVRDAIFNRVSSGRVNHR